MNTEYFKLAKLFNDNHKDLLLKESVHFRGSINSISLISVSELSPELGIKCNAKSYRSAGNPEEQILNDIIKIKSTPHRSTPEKVLQSWIIRQALNDHDRMPFDKDIRFITSELAILNIEGTKLVCDILGYNSAENRICVIELKTKRDQSVLIKQVNEYEKVIIENPDFFSEILTLYSYPGSCLQNNVKKITIWPHNENSPKSEFVKENITEVTYQNHCTFKVY